MRIVALSEDESDEVFVRRIAEAVLGVSIEPIEHPFRARGWPNVHRVLPAVIKHLHYRTAAEGLIVVVDTDDSSVHESRHATPDMCAPDCRLCLLRSTARSVTQHLTPVSGREPIRVAVGASVPAIEAWYRAGLDPQSTEAAAIEQRSRGLLAARRRALKLAAYGTETPIRAQMLPVAQREANRLAADTRMLIGAFPSGFGSLVADLRSWPR